MNKMCINEGEIGITEGKEIGGRRKDGGVKEKQRERGKMPNSGLKTRNFCLVA